MRINVDYSDIESFSIRVDRYKSTHKQDIKKAVKTSAYNIAKGAQSNLTSNGSVNKGHLRRSIQVKLAGEFDAEIGSSLNYASAVEKGSKPHVIKPKYKKALSWKGISHPVQKVNHKGNKAKPYLLPAAKKEMPNFIRNLKEVVKIK